MEAVTVETIHQEITGLHNDITLIKNILLEEYELSDLNFPYFFSLH